MSRNFDVLQRAMTTRQPVTMATTVLPAGEVQRRFDSHEAANGGLWKYFGLLRRNGKNILLATVASGVVALLISLAMKPMYAAVARIVVNREITDPLGLRESGQSTSDDEDYMVALDTQADILNSDSIAMETIRRLNLNADPEFLAGGIGATKRPDTVLQHFRENFSASRVPRSRIIEISFASQDAAKAARIVNTAIDAYLDNNFNTKFVARKETSDWLSAQLGDLKQQVERSQAALVDFQKEHGIIEPESKQNVVTTELDELSKAEAAAQADRVEKESKYRAASAGDAEVIASGDPNTLMNKLRAQEADLETQLAQATTTLGPAHPKVLELNSELRTTEETIKRQTARVAQRFKSEYQTAKEREDLLRAELDKQKQMASQLNEASVEYNILKRDFESNRDVYDQLLNRYKQAGVSAGLRANNVVLVDAARPPAKAYSPRIVHNVFLTMLTCSFGFIGLAFLLESLQQQRKVGQVNSEEQVQTATQLTALAVVPQLSDGGVRSIDVKRFVPSDVARRQYAPELAICSRPQSPVAESFRALRSAILLGSAHPKVIIVTSALPQEGKTVTSANLAVALAQVGRRVLLIEADLRRPRLERLFGLGEASEGITNVGDLRHIMKPPMDGLPNLLYVPAGPAPQDATEILSSENFRQFLHWSRGAFDHVILDTPPVLSVTDPVLLAGDADLVLMVTRFGVPLRAVLKARDQLVQANNCRVSLVLNAVDLSGPAYEYLRYGSDKHDTRDKRAAV